MEKIRLSYTKQTMDGVQGEKKVMSPCVVMNVRFFMENKRMSDAVIHRFVQTKRNLYTYQNLKKP